MLIPRGFAHGFSVLSETAICVYKCDNFYDKASETGLYHADKHLNIDWKVPENDRIVSEKDQQQPLLKNTAFWKEY
jgi:dTDP-4-dehydrorhamnose 3,5-epimerase